MPKHASFVGGRADPTRPTPDSSAIPLSSRPIDPITRTALRYTVSPREYAVLHQYLLSRSETVRTRAPYPPKYAADVAAKGGDYNGSAFRSALRVFAVSMTAFKAWDWLLHGLGTSGLIQSNKARPSLGWKKIQVRLSSTLALVLLFHRLLYRFLLRLRHSLLLPSTRAFRVRNWFLTSILTSRFTPPVGASLSGAFLALYPASQLRITISIYALSRALEFTFNALEIDGFFTDAPAWFGSWLLLPFSCAQLFSNFILDRNCLPSSVLKVGLATGGPYLDTKPDGFVPPLKALPWPSSTDILDGIRNTSKLGWPSFTSPILFPDWVRSELPPSMAKLSVITATADPCTSFLSCALLHPNDPSCLRTWVKYCMLEFPRISKLMALAVGAISIITRFQNLIDHPVRAVGTYLTTVVRTSVAITAGLATSWGSLCFFNSIMSTRFLPQSRLHLAGALAGLWAYLLHSPRNRSRILHPSVGEGASGISPASAVVAASTLASRISGSRSHFLSIFRYALISAWQSAQKRTAISRRSVTKPGGRGSSISLSKSPATTILLSLARLPFNLLSRSSDFLVRNADVAVFVISLALIQVLHVARAPAIQGKPIRFACSWLLGEGFVDRCEVIDQAVEKQRRALRVQQSKDAAKTTLAPVRKDEKAGF